MIQKSVTHKDGFWKKHGFLMEISEMYIKEKNFTYDKYIQVENLYINAILQFMTCLNISHLQVKELLESSDRINSDPLARQSRSYVC